MFLFGLAYQNLLVALMANYSLTQGGRVEDDVYIPE